MDNGGFPKTWFKHIICPECGKDLYADMVQKSIECHICKHSVDLPKVDRALLLKDARLA